MTSNLWSVNRCVGVATLIFFLGSAAWAQAPVRRSSPPDPPKLGQSPPSANPRPEDDQTNADKSRTEAERKAREMDRRLNRTLRGVCVGC
jgi:hypothetical protein